MDKDDIIREYQKSINKIDDYFEYGYQSEVDKDQVITILDKLANDLLTLSRG